MGQVVVEHVDTGALTLHEETCPHAKRAMITHRATQFWLRDVDKVCKTCHPEAPNSK